MSTSAVIGLSVLAVLGLFHVVTAIGMTRLLAASHYFDRWQKVAQGAIIWLIPILGTAVVATVLAPEIKVKRKGVPWLPYVLVAAFVSSASEAVETAGSENGAASSEGAGGDA
jgi:hypothetical protein